MPARDLGFLFENLRNNLQAETLWTQTSGSSSQIRKSKVIYGVTFLAKIIILLKIHFFKNNNFNFIFIIMIR